MKKLVITIVLLVFHLLGVNIGYVWSDFAPINHLIFALCHANVFHLLCNLIALWAIKGRMYLVPAIIINLLASYMPTMTFEPTFGFSGVLFAVMGCKWGAYFVTEKDYSILKVRAYNCLVYCCLPLFICSFLPNINWCLHLYAFAMGIMYGAIKYRHCL